MVAFNLSPPTRGGQVQTLTVPTQTDQVTFRLGLEATGFPAYQVSLKNPATGQIVWRSGRLKAGKSGVVIISVPAGVFRAQNYLIELSGISADGRAEDVGGYPFRVVRP